MPDIASYIRIFNADPSDDLVNKRSVSIKALASRWAKGGRDIFAIFETANGLALGVESKGAFPEAMSKEIEDAIRKQADAFVAEGKQLEMMTCGLLAAALALENGKPSVASLSVSDVLATGLWLALSFQSTRKEAKLEELRREVSDAASNQTLRSAASARVRVPVPEPSIKAADELNAEKIAETVRAGLRQTIDALRANALVDREEIDLLWWVLSDWSRTLSRRYSDMANASLKAVVSGIDAGRILRRVPGDIHHNLVVRNVDRTTKASLKELIESLGADRPAIASEIDQTVERYPAIFPLSCALRTGDAKGAAASQKRSLVDWAGRALVESAAWQFAKTLDGNAI